MYNQLVGAVRLRQQRVTNHSCVLSDNVQRNVEIGTTRLRQSFFFPAPNLGDGGGCFREYNRAAQETLPFGPCTPYGRSLLQGHLHTISPPPPPPSPHHLPHISPPSPHHLLTISPHLPTSPHHIPTSPHPLGAPYSQTSPTSTSTTSRATTAASSSGQRRRRARRGLCHSATVRDMSVISMLTSRRQGATRRACRRNASR